MSDEAAFVLLDNELEGRIVASYLTDDGAYSTSQVKSLTNILIAGNSVDGWTVFDVFFMRLNNSRLSNPNALPVSSTSTDFIYGYDGVACVQRTEPWIIEVYNGSDSVTATNLLRRGGNLDGNLGPLASKSKLIGGQTTNSTRNLSSNGKVDAYFGAYSSSIYAWLQVSHSIC